MQVVAGGDTGAAGIADQLACTDIGTAANSKAVQVHINGLESVMVVNGNVVACCGAVGGVGTEPEYRRGGLVREIFTEMAAECDRRAIPLTILHPFSFAYYRAFGFERVADHRVLEFPITAMSFVPRYPDLIRCTGDTHNAELAEVYNTFAADGRHLLFKRSPNHFPTADGAKKVCYNELDIPLVAIDDLEELGKDNELYRELAKIVKENGVCIASQAIDNRVVG